MCRTGGRPGREAVTMPSIMPGPTAPLLYAHRGVSVEFPENTLEAFTAARARGADGVELDVRRTADDELVVHHDAHLADGRPLIGLRRVELPTEVPTLREAMAACAGVKVNIEIKNFPGEPDHDDTGIVAAGVVGMVRDLDRVADVVVSAFNYLDLVHVRRLGPEVPTGWLVLAVDDVDRMVSHVVDDGHVALHPPADATTAEVVAAAHDRGVQVNTWTVDDAARIVELADLGVDGIITNDPVAARAALDARPDPRS